MARGNEAVQQRLFDRLDMLLNIQGAEGAMAEALTEVCTRRLFHSLHMHNPRWHQPIGDQILLPM